MISRRNVGNGHVARGAFVEETHRADVVTVIPLSGVSGGQGVSSDAHATEEAAVQPNPNIRTRPAVLTIAEVMDVLRIGRTKAYEQARLYLDTNGQAGLPCVKVGDSIRFLRHAIEDLIGEPITTTPVHDDTDPTRTTTTPRTVRPRPTTDTKPQLFTA